MGNVVHIIADKNKELYIKEFKLTKLSKVLPYPLHTSSS